MMYLYATAVIVAAIMVLSRPRPLTYAIFCMVAGLVATTLVGHPRAPWFWEQEFDDVISVEVRVNEAIYLWVRDDDGVPDAIKLPYETELAEQLMRGQRMARLRGGGSFRFNRAMDPNEAVSHPRPQDPEPDDKP
jgi:hypothetical protein